MSIPNPERVGYVGGKAVTYVEDRASDYVQQLKENRANKLTCAFGLLFIGLSTCVCTAAAKFGFEKLSEPSIITPVKLSTPTNTFISFPTPTPWMVTPEMLTPDNLCITVQSGDTAGEIFKKLVEMGHDPNKAVRYFPPNSANPQLFMSNNLPWRIDPKGIFCGQR